MMKRKEGRKGTWMKGRTRDATVRRGKRSDKTILRNLSTIWGEATKIPGIVHTGRTRSKVTVWLPLHHTHFPFPSLSLSEVCSFLFYYIYIFLYLNYQHSQILRRSGTKQGLLRNTKRHLSKFCYYTPRRSQVLVCSSPHPARRREARCNEKGGY